MIKITVTMVPKMIMAVRYIFMKKFLKMCFNQLCKKTSIEMLLLKKYDFPEWWWWWWWWSCDMHKKYISMRLLLSSLRIYFCKSQTLACILKPRKIAFSSFNGMIFSSKTVHCSIFDYVFIFSKIYFLFQKRFLNLVPWLW